MDFFCDPLGRQSSGPAQVRGRGGADAVDPTSKGSTSNRNARLHKGSGGRRKDHAAVSLLHEKFQPIGAGSGYGIASLFLPGHPIPATLFNGLSSLPAIDFPEGLEFLVR